MSTHADGTAEQVPMLESAISSLSGLENLIAAANSLRISSLHDACSELERLDAALAAERGEQLTGFYKLEVDERLKRLEELSETQRSEFDVLDFVGQMRFGSGRDLWGWEEFHSNVLAWLLDPGQGHGLGDCFLRSFLSRASVPSADWSGTVVTREWRNVVDGRPGSLDILVLNEAEKVLCAIENKVFSSEHSEQLTRYRIALERSYPAFMRNHVFLTPWATRPVQEAERGYWESVPYSAVFETVQQIVENDNLATNDGVRAFLRQYATTLRRNLMSETSIPQIARRLYLEHQEAMDQIIANKPDWVAEAKQWLKEAIELQQEWKLDAESPAFVRFRAADWDQYEAMRTGTGWAPQSSALLLFQFRFDGGVPWLDLGLSPGNATNNGLREKLFEAVRQHPKLFSPRTTSLPDGWAILHYEEDYILDNADYGVGWDDGTTRAKLEKWVEDFAANEFPGMNEVIVHCLREHEAEPQT